MAFAAPKFTPKRSQPKRGDIKIKMFKIIGSSFKDVAIGVTRKAVKVVKEGGGVCGCISSPATVIPFEAASESKIMQFRGETELPDVEVAVGSSA